ncbi:MAG: 4'-phosphopantetheinyl transferase superfamily protein [Clostridia bacterium]|nr:4'-phosphopantetheinyl transferase superfamily protein [Clostridia bacterium]
MEKIRLFFCTTRQIEKNEDSIKRLLKDNEISKAARFVRKADRLLSLGSSYLKRRFVFGDGDITVSDLGKPYSPDIFFNVSHSVDIVGIALSDNYEVGLDIEKERGDYSDLANHCLSTEEKQSGEDFLTLFTSKESVAKAEGGGLKTDIRDIPALPLDGRVQYKCKTYYRHGYFKAPYHISISLYKTDFYIEEEHINEF